MFGHPCRVRTARLLVPGHVNPFATRSIQCASAVFFDLVIRGAWHLSYRMRLFDCMYGGPWFSSERFENACK